MKTKKLKKLVLKKETIASLSREQQSELKGGGSAVTGVMMTVFDCIGSYLKGCCECVKDTAIYAGGDCATYDQEICRWSDYHCNEGLPIY
ncbi:class I lanthipeptide [Parabacteroides pacaensis]|uniref:class I lanthipeptide n=1 Tax=Parabacteroides pacaensis TaxID=2086575 RepID=UPI00131BF406|nr:class I lanthipeptide [Parabacteroides pacaensis]